MPKSKKRKKKYTPVQKVAQPSAQTRAQPVARVSEPAPTAPAPTAPAAKTSRSTVKTQVNPPVSNIGSELKILGIITALIITAIVVFYFIFR